MQTLVCAVEPEDQWTFPNPSHLDWGKNLQSVDLGRYTGIRYTLQKSSFAEGGLQNATGAKLKKNSLDTAKMVIRTLPTPTPTQGNTAQGWTNRWQQPHQQGKKNKMSNCPAVPVLQDASGETTFSAAGPPWLKGGKRLEKKQIIWKSIKVIQLLLTAPSRKSTPQASENTTTGISILGPQAPPVPQILKPHLSPLCGWFLVSTLNNRSKTNSGRLWGHSENRPGQWAREKPKTWAIVPTSWKQDRRFQ